MIKILVWRNLITNSNRYSKGSKKTRKLRKKIKRKRLSASKQRVNHLVLKKKNKRRKRNHQVHHQRKKTGRKRSQRIQRNQRKVRNQKNPLKQLNHNRFSNNHNKKRRSICWSWTPLSHHSNTNNRTSLICLTRHQHQHQVLVFCLQTPHLNSSIKPLSNINRLTFLICLISQPTPHLKTLCSSWINSNRMFQLSHQVNPSNRISCQASVSLLKLNKQLTSSPTSSSILHRSNLLNLNSQSLNNLRMPGLWVRT